MAYKIETVDVNSFEDVLNELEHQEWRYVNHQARGAVIVLVVHKPGIAQSVLDRLALEKVAAEQEAKKRKHDADQKAKAAAAAAEAAKAEEEAAIAEAEAAAAEEEALRKAKEADLARDLEPTPPREPTGLPPHIDDGP